MPKYDLAGPGKAPSATGVVGSFGLFLRYGLYICYVQGVFDVQRFQMFEMFWRYGMWIPSRQCGWHKPPQAVGRRTAGTFFLGRSEGIPKIKTRCQNLPLRSMRFSRIVRNCRIQQAVVEKYGRRVNLLPSRLWVLCCDPVKEIRNSIMNPKLICYTADSERHHVAACFGNSSSFATTNQVPLG